MRLIKFCCWALAVLCILLLVISLLLKRVQPNVTSAQNLPVEATLTYSTEHNYRQGYNQCGPYSAAAALRALKQNIEPATTVADLPWRLPRDYTHPWALESLLESQGANVQAYNISSLHDDEIISFIQSTIYAGQPLIILTNLHGYQHYVTLLGYDDTTNTIDVYDPAHTKLKEGYTTDDNGLRPGNISMAYSELINYWRGGGVLGFYKGYGLVVSLP